MFIDSYRRDIERYQNEISRYQQDKAREVGKVAEESRRANAASEAARRSSSVSTAQSRLNDAQRYQESAARAQKTVAEIEAKIARAHSQLNDAHRRLAGAEEQESRRRIQQQQRAEKEHEKRMSTIAGQLNQHAHLHEVTISEIKRLRNLPAQITVLFLAANPVDQEQLRLDEEVRLIGEMIRKSAHRDAVKLESRWAVRPLDVLQAINECTPTVIHFSGHGSEQDEIVFQDNSGHTKLVSKEAIVQTMAAGSDEIQLVFFNTCYSRAQAEAVVAHVPAAIGMSTAIGDEAARIFSAQFYSAVGFGLSVGKAFQQARAALMLEGIAEDSTPELFASPGLDAFELVLVKSNKDSQS